jgi:hypothetical protein
MGVDELAAAPLEALALASSDVVALKQALGIRTVRRVGVRMQYQVGAEQLEQVPSLARRPDGIFRSARTWPVGPTHAVDATTGAAACGITAQGLEVLDQDWEAASFVQKCPGCFAAVLSHGQP